METKNILFGESDFDWNINQEDAGKEVTINMPEDAYYHGKKGTIRGTHRTEQDMPIDAYWVCFDNIDDDIWFLPEELTITQMEN